VLALLVSLCCCRVNTVVAMLPGGQAPDGTTASACATASSCCQHSTSGSGHPDGTSENDIPSENGCGGLCCLKGTTPDQGASFSDILPLIGILSIADVTATSGDSLTTRRDAAESLPGSPCTSLLRLRCALLI
jgi:hypothetical protein